MGFENLNASGKAGSNGVNETEQAFHDDTVHDEKGNNKGAAERVLYYRPIWTCGRYNADAQAAIFYNLLEGICIYFEGVSAEVIGFILSIPRNKPFNIETLSQGTDIKINSLIAFVEQLEQYGLITEKIFSEIEIKHYRNNLKKTRKQHVADSIKELQDMTVVSTASAERMYMERVGTITSAMLELTYRCSENCVHCYNAGAARNKTENNRRGARMELSINDYKRIIDELYELGVTKICLSGGDPFSKNIVWEIIDYLYEKEIAIDIFTNGIGIVNQVDRLSRYYPRTIGVSLYSNVAEVHDSITRIKGSHDITLSFIKNCSQLALPMIIKCCIMKPNVSSYYTVKEVANKYGALTQFDLNITDSVEGDKSASLYLRLSHDELELVLRDRDLPYYISNDGIKETIKNDDDLMCNAGLNTLCITPEGNIQPCCAFPLKLGNVRDGSISEVVEKSELLRWWKSQTIKSCKECFKHPYCVYCQMCAGNNYISHGNPLIASENNCFLAKERYDLAVKMQNGYDPLHGKDLESALSSIQIEEIREFGRVPSINYRDDARINGMS